MQPQNSHHVVPLIPTNSTRKLHHFTFKIAPKQPWKHHKNDAKKKNAPRWRHRRRQRLLPPSRHLRRQRSSSSPAAAASTFANHAPPCLETGPAFTLRSAACAFQALYGFLVSGVAFCTPRICAYTHSPLNYQNVLNPNWVSDWWGYFLHPTYLCLHPYSSQLPKCP